MGRRDERSGLSNAFDSASYPTREPEILIAGDRWAWKRTDLGSDYPPASYTLKYSARLEGDGATEIEITASASGTEFLVEVASTNTATYTAGTYHWQAYIVRDADSERVTVDRGTFEVRPNRDTATADPRSHARKVLDSIETVIEALAAKRHGSYSLLGRTMTYRDLPELREMRDRYRAEVVLEERAERRRRGLGHDGRVLVRL